MPSSTFNNLNASKKAAFIDACLSEFAQKGYYGASVTAIVKELKIAKGSVYQYFENKENLYKFLITHSLDTKSELLNLAKPNTSNLRDWMFSYLIVEIKFTQGFTDMSKLLIDSHSPMNSMIRNREMDSIKSGVNNFKTQFVNTDMAIIVDVLYSIKNEIASSAQILPAKTVISKVDQIINLLLNGMTKQSYES
jgi:AcrR family transcriptional regulator